MKNIPMYSNGLVSFYDYKMIIEMQSQKPIVTIPNNLKNGQINSINKSNKKILKRTIHK